ncbi:MAG TPA: S41 family peptidase [Xanthobacteraceae bacterium]|nr:S41 family peptidase [Xanthobacteraceae bacterium]
MKAPLIVLGVAAGMALTIVGTQSYVALGGTDPRLLSAPPTNYRLLDVFGDAYEQVRKHYVEKPNDRDLMGTAINGMLASLEDSYYVDAKTLRNSQACTDHCEFGDLGIAFTMVDGYAKIISAVDDSPAAKAGIMTGDIITELDGLSASGLTHYQMTERLRGAPGTTVKMTIVRPGRDKQIELSLVRAKLDTRSVRARIEGGDVGYIRIAEFDSQTAEQLKQAIADIATKVPADQLKGYVLDLRNDAGGPLDDAIPVANDFLDSGEIVEIKGRSAEDTKHIRATAADLAKGKSLVVLINAGSAATSEVVAGALQDAHRATLVGTHTFGQGSVGTLIALGPDNGAIHLTTGHYVTPAGHPIEGKGISPDVEAAQDLPDDLKPSPKAELKDPKLQSYIPADPKADKALNVALDTLRHPKTGATVPPVKN